MMAFKYWNTEIYPWKQIISSQRYLIRMKWFCPESDVVNWGDYLLRWWWCTGGGGRLWSGSRDVWRSAMKAKTDKTVFTCKLLLTAFCQIKSLSCKMKILEEAALEKRMGWAKNWQFGGSDDCSRHNRGFCHQTFPNRRRISVAVYSRKEILKIGNKSWHKLLIVKWKWM